MLRHLTITAQAAASSARRIANCLLLQLPPHGQQHQLHTSPATLGKKYAKYYYTPKIIHRKEEIFRVRRTDAILPQERLDAPQLAIPEASPPTPEEADLLRQLTAAVGHADSSSSSCGRHFAVVHLAGKQFKVTEGDLVHVVGKSYLAEPGDQLLLEKVLAVGCADFTVFGRPILSRECATVRATVVEKTLEAPKIRFEFKKRQNFGRMNVVQTNATVLRIGAIELHKDTVLRSL